MTGGDLINSSLRLIGVLASGEVPSAAESNDALMILQQMVDQWQAERLTIFTISINEFPMVPLKQTYSLGLGGDFNIPRPARLEKASIVWLADPSQPLELPLQMYTHEEWQEKVPIKLIQSTLPTVLYNDMAFPLMNLNYWPIPTVVNNTRLYIWQALNTFPDLFTDITFPPSYLKAIRYNLAVDLAAEFPGNPGSFATVQQIAMESKGILKSLNAPPPLASCEEALVNPAGGHYDWRSDTYGGRR